MMHLEHYQRIRQYEIELATKFLPSHGLILEIGAGAGWQAAYLSKRGYSVIALDVPESNYSTAGNYPILLYDGVHIPLADHSVDAVFSSNTLEHVRDLPGLLAELHRVLKPGGVGVHLMPTPAWRLWTMLGLYVDVLKRIQRRLVSPRTQEAGINIPAVEPPQRTFLAYLRYLLIPERHGEIGNALTELYFFSPRRWRKVFTNSGWYVSSITPVGIFYTGWLIFNMALNIPSRQRLSQILGSSCAVYVVQRLK